MNLPDGERLLLTIDREVEVECDYDVFSFSAQRVIERCVNGLVDNDKGCPKCRGTGRITRRVRGWIEVEADHHGGSAQMRTFDGLYNIGGNEFPGLREGLTDSIVASYLSGTLPDANITMEDI